MKRISPVLLVLLVGALPACNCGKSDSAPRATSAASSGTSSMAPAAPAAPEPPPPIPAPADVAAPPADAQRTESGLASKVLGPGTGTEHPRAHDVVRVHYTGWTTDGQMFDSSVRRGEPAEFPLNRVIPGWTEGLQLMVVGEKRRLWIPQELAYRGMPGRPQGMLVFDVELLDIRRAGDPPPAPEDLRRPPRGPACTANGVCSRVLVEGTGAIHPVPSDRVRMSFAGWTSDGRLFEATQLSGVPGTFPVSGLVPGLSEGLQAMVAGEKRRIWVPERLGYAGRPGAPVGDLVFDVELLEIVR